MMPCPSSLETISSLTWELVFGNDNFGSCYEQGSFKIMSSTESKEQEREGQLARQNAEKVF